MEKKTVIDFIGEDGMLHCGVCGHPKECRPVGMPREYLERFGDGLKIRCMCKCQTDAIDRETEAQRLQAMVADAKDESRKAWWESGLLGSVYFEDFDEQTENEETLKKYVAGFPQFRDDGIGLLLEGPVGNGKTYAAAAIGNELILKGFPVAFVVSAAYVGADYKEQLWLLNNHFRYPLLIIDDLGAERRTSYGAETMYKLIDSRYNHKLPMIITTNVTHNLMDAEHDIDRIRLYDRVRERMMPVVFRGASRRKKIYQSVSSRAKDIFASVSLN